MDRRITSHEIYGGAENIPRQVEQFHQLQIQSGRTHTRTTYSDKMGDFFFPETMVQAFADGANG